jgi:predicted MFS family arabinose efflux permease
MIFVGRLLTFCFGMKYWIFGYCLLYFGVGIFLGNIIVDKRLPMRF